LVNNNNQLINQSINQSINHYQSIVIHDQVDGNIYEQDGNSTLVEGERLVLDSSVFNITTSKSSPLSSSSSASVSSAASPSSREGSQGVIAVRLNNDTGGSFSGMGKGDGSRIGGSFYTLLSRNTDLAGLRIVGQPREKMMDSSLSSQQGGGARGFGSAAYQVKRQKSREEEIRGGGVVTGSCVRKMGRTNEAHVGVPSLFLNCFTADVSFTSPPPTNKHTD
jgi:hypothetical protein